MGVKVKQSRRLLAGIFAVTVAIFSFGISAQASFAASSSTMSKCTKTTATGHDPIPVATPDATQVPVDRTFTLNTNCGQIVFKAFGHKAPITVIAMTALAKAGYFDHSLCHRLTTAGFFVLQCGDPSATGRGVPPFYYQSENLPTTTTNDYPAGTVAMANRGVAYSTGSQFFIVYKDTTLPPTYSIWGMVTKGLDIVKNVAAAGVVGGGTDGKPKMAIAIDSVIVK